MLPIVQEQRAIPLASYAQPIPCTCNLASHIMASYIHCLYLSTCGWFMFMLETFDRPLFHSIQLYVCTGVVSLMMH